MNACAASPSRSSVAGAMDPLDLRLVNDFQRDLPLVPRPFEAMAHAVGCGEAQVLSRLAALRERGVVSRIGAVFAPRRVGASTLAALAVPEGRLAQVAAMVSAQPGVNHNYRREHRYNLWFVVTATDDAQLHAMLGDIARRAGCPLLDLPLQEEFHIDLGFDLVRASKGDVGGRPVAARRAVLSPPERALMGALQEGLDPVSRPFARIAERAGTTEEAVLRRLRRWRDEGIIKRFGVVVRHHELGYRANAMVAWDVPDERVPALGERLAAEPDVTLCYRRRRQLPEWPYNLFCMIHGQAKTEVMERLAALGAGLELEGLPCVVLFSTRRYKQRGAHYVWETGAAHG